MPKVPPWVRATRIKPGVYAAAAAFVLGGLAVTDPALQAVTIASYAVAVGLLVWGTTIHTRHVWQPWWHGPPFPLRIDAWTAQSELEPGSEVYGIPWKKGYSLVQLRLTNIMKVSIEDVSVTISPEYPIFQSRSWSEFADTRISSAVAPPTGMTIHLTAKDGSEKAFAPQSHAFMVVGAPHRLQCERMPSGATVDVHLATAVFTGAPHIHSDKRADPTFVDLELRWTVAGLVAEGRNRINLADREH